ncbi:hypothetical protein IMG5_121810 [Ichthyophthirius multifiliis]|uniref:Uncharacterized protein n=1 Tax=Ichthyophthirius multifiliis TaxID=5932 RepID=G0QV70_ICHMU|nr:hypothetical protein IMG5_121810 [Ichthyophthirius multifiliis]EGR30883.1 hypothetical protein IMG5_121810 [Ichthyophthirius multifiliis]|eukprot:XP_004032470.1 hypothetical protein IMG5_121810 [Ichthyophthirius multifiliis]
MGIYLTLMLRQKLYYKFCQEKFQCKVELKFQKKKNQKKCKINKDNSKLQEMYNLQNAKDSKQKKKEKKMKLKEEVINIKVFKNKKLVFIKKLFQEILQLTICILQRKMFLNI